VSFYEALNSIIINLISICHLKKLIEIYFTEFLLIFTRYEKLYNKN